MLQRMLLKMLSHPKSWEYSRPRKWLCYFVSLWRGDWYRDTALINSLKVTCSYLSSQHEWNSKARNLDAHLVSPIFHCRLILIFTSIFSEAWWWWCDGWHLRSWWLLLTLRTTKQCALAGPGWELYTRVETPGLSNRHMDPVRGESPDIGHRRRR